MNSNTSLDSLLNSNNDIATNQKGNTFKASGMPPSPMDDRESFKKSDSTTSGSSSPSHSDAQDEKIDAARLLTAIARSATVCSDVSSDDLPPLASVLTLLSMSRGIPPKYASFENKGDHRHFAYARSPESMPTSPRVPSFRNASPYSSTPSTQQPRVENYMTIDHSDKKRKFRCAIGDCDKGFPSRAHLERHQRGVHFKIRPFKCPHPTCEKTFSRHDNMMQHYRSHQNDLRNDQKPTPVVEAKFRH